MTWTIDGLGACEPVDAPDGLRCWRRETPVEPPLHIVVDPDEDGDDVDTTHAARVAGSLPELLLVAERAVREAVAEDPARFEAFDSDVPLDLDAPEITLWTKRRWMVRFADCALPAASVLGVAVEFVDTNPVDVYPLDDAAAVD